MTLDDMHWVLGMVAMAVMSFVHAIVWRGTHERAAASYALAYLGGSLYCLVGYHVRSTSGFVRPELALLSYASLALLAFGMIDRAGLAGSRIGTALCAYVVGVGLVVTSVGWITASLPVAYSIDAYTTCMLGIAGVAAYAAWRQPGRGFGYIFVSLLGYPLLLVLGVTGWFAVEELRIFGVVPHVVFGIVVLTVGLLQTHGQALDEIRRRRQAERDLQALNESLENEVAARTADLQNLVAALEGFNQNVSHDLRGPLGTIALAADMAIEQLEMGDEDKALQWMRRIAKQATTSAGLVSSLLMLAQIQKSGLERVDVNVDALVRDVVDELAARHGGGNQLSVRIAGPLPQVRADAGLLRQLYVNLLQNAIKFSSVRERIEIEVGAEHPPSGAVVYHVRDNGVGFNPEQAAKLFQPFKRLHAKRFEGHGIGLSIVRRIVDHHGGTIWAESQPDQGATFRFSLGSVGPKPPMAAATGT